MIRREEPNPYTVTHPVALTEPPRDVWRVRNLRGGSHLDEGDRRIVVAPTVALTGNLVGR
jgi:hypothetical protein